MNVQHLQHLHSAYFRSNRTHIFNRGFITSIASSSSTPSPIAATSSQQDNNYISNATDTKRSGRRYHKARRQAICRSLGSQADVDLLIDTTMARSSDVYNQRHRSGAPSLTITTATKDNLPQFLTSSRSEFQRQHNTKLQSTASDTQIRPSGHKSIRQSGDVDEKAASQIDENDIEEILGNDRPSLALQSKEPFHAEDKGSISARQVDINEVKPHREMKIARLRRSLGRVLFSPGVSPLRDPRTGVWNFEPSLHDIPQPDKFAFHRCPPYITPSQDEELIEMAQRHQCQFVGSTSTLTKALSQIYFAISGGKGVDLSTLSQDFSFTPGAELPASIIIDKLPNDIYSVDSDKRWDIENVISDFGRILEKMLTCEAADFKRFLLNSPESAVPEEERTAKEAYRYQRVNSLLMRSQLDCYDPRLPGHGVFDIKTRACLPIRYDRANYQENSAYDISKDRGYNQSYEREYYDLLRAGMLKFSLQVRIGGMDGIFLAYHNTSRLFGFQYISLTEIDQRIFGSTEMADQAFKISVALLEQLLHKCVAMFPDQAVNVMLKHSPAVQANSVTAYVEPKDWDLSKGDRPIRAITLNMENLLDDEVTHGPIAFSVDEKIRRKQNWSVNYTLSCNNIDAEGEKKARDGLKRLQQDLLAMNSLTVPAGESVKSMVKKDGIARHREKKAQRKEQESGNISEAATTPSETDSVFTKIRWREPGARQVQLREEAKESGRAYAERKKTWKKGKFAWTV